MGMVVNGDYGGGMVIMEEAWWALICVEVTKWTITTRLIIMTLSI